MQQPAIGSVRSESRVRRRAAILEAALTLVGEADFESLTMEAIAAQAHLTKPTLYAYFESKEEILLEAIVQHIQLATEMLDELSATYSPSDSLTRFSCWLIQQRFLDGTVIFGMSARHLRLDTRYRIAKQRLLDRIAVEIDRAQKARLVPATVPITFHAATYLGLIRDFNQRMRLDGVANPPPNEVAYLVTVLQTSILRMSIVV